MGLLDIGSYYDGRVIVKADPRVGNALMNIAESQKVQTDVRASELYHTIRETVIRDMAFSRIEFPENCSLKINAVAVYDPAAMRKSVFYRATVNGRLIEGEIDLPTIMDPNIRLIQEAIQTASQKFLTEVAGALSAGR